MNWTNVRKALGTKLQSEHIGGKKHDRWLVRTAKGKVVGYVKDSHGKGDITNHELGHIAKSLRLNEFKALELLRCTMSREAYDHIVAQEDSDDSGGD